MNDKRRLIKSFLLFLIFTILSILSYPLLVFLVFHEDFYQYRYFGLAFLCVVHILLFISAGITVYRLIKFLTNRKNKDDHIDWYGFIFNDIK